MQDIKIIELKRTILEDNDADANLLRQQLKEKEIFLINLMSSPGSGKTTTLLALADQIKGKAKFAVMEADIDSDVDAKTLVKSGIPSIQLHTGGMCHLDADMTRQGIKEFNDIKDSIVVLENIGNLVCPAEFDTGAHKNIAILSITEGDDKPAKYPLMFKTADLILFNKIDTLEYFDFDVEKCKSDILKLNPNAVILTISAKTGEGISELAKWVIDNYKQWKKTL